MFFDFWNNHFEGGVKKRKLNEISTLSKHGTDGIPKKTHIQNIKPTPIAYAYRQMVRKK